MILSPLFKQRFFDDNGDPLVLGKVYSYEAGSSTPQVTYSNYTGTTNTNPVILDANGYADIWLDPSKAYKIVLADSLDNILWTVDKVQSPPASALRTVTTNTTLLTSDSIVRSNSTSASLTHILPACSTTPTGFQLTVKDIGTGGFTTTIQGNGTDNVDGNNVYSPVLVGYDSRTFLNNGVSWDVI